MASTIFSVLEGVLGFEAGGREDFAQEARQRLLAELAAELGALEYIVQRADVGAQLDHLGALALQLAELVLELIERFVAGAEVLEEVLLAGLEVLFEGGGVFGLAFADGFELLLEEADGGGLADEVFAGGEVLADLPD